MAAVIVPAVVAIILGQMALHSIGYRDSEWLPFPLFFVPALLLVLVIAKRHS